MKWSIRNCGFRYLLKTNDNVFINIRRLWEYLNRANTPKTNLYVGYVNYETRVQRTGPYAVPKDVYPKKIYPRYCSSAGYVLSSDTVRKMVENFPEVRIFKTDDAYIGEVALVSGIDVSNNEKFRIYENPWKCTFNADSIIHHPVGSLTCMETMYRQSMSSSRRK